MRDTFIGLFCIFGIMACASAEANQTLEAEDGLNPLKSMMVTDVWTNFKSWNLSFPKPEIIREKTIPAYHWMLEQSALAGFEMQIRHHDEVNVPT